MYLYIENLSLERMHVEKFKNVYNTYNVRKLYTQQNIMHLHKSLLNNILSAYQHF